MTPLVAEIELPVPEHDVEFANKPQPDPSISPPLEDTEISVPDAPVVSTQAPAGVPTRYAATARAVWFPAISPVRPMPRTPEKKSARGVVTVAVHNVGDEPVGTTVTQSRQGVVLVELVNGY